MPKLFSTKCNSCDFETSASSGGYLYVLGENNSRVACPHPGEAKKIAEVLKIPESDAFAWVQHEYDEIPVEIKKKIDSSTGMNLQYVCLDCLKEVWLDKEKDELRCDDCGSSNLKYVADLAGQPCPKCKEGTLEVVAKGLS